MRAARERIVDRPLESEGRQPSTEPGSFQAAAAQSTELRATLSGESQGPVQTLSDSASQSAAEIRGLATEGLRGPSTSLPHHDAIQKSFGKHDVSSVQAFVGGSAKSAGEAMGARAYTAGGKVAFAAKPDLHTAAHEAAHVVQQRAGVDLPGGVGKAGDAYEQHADAVADRVVAGQSAESLLSQSTDSAPAVQHSVQMAGQTGASGVEELPEEHYEEQAGVKHRLFIEVQGDQATVMQQSKKQAVRDVSDSQNPFKIALKVEKATREYIKMPKGGPKTRKLKYIKGLMGQLSTAMRVARGDLLIDTKLRKGFEKKLGDKAFEGTDGRFADGKKAVDDAFLEMVNMIGLAYAPRAKAADDIKQAFKKFEKVKENAKFREAIESLGKELTSGYAGAVGTEYDKIKGALSPSADMNQKIVHLHRFTETDFFDKEVTKKDGLAYERMQQNMGEKWRKAMDKQIDNPKVKGKKKAEFKETGGGYKDAKAKDMDRKRPYQPIENLNLDSLKHIARQKNVPKSKVDACLRESSEEKRRVKLCNLLKAPPYNVRKSGKMASWDPEKKAQGGDAASFVGPDELIGYNKGVLDNLLDANNSWVKNARALRMPLTSGISGTTRRVCGVGLVLGIKDISHLRLAMLGQCIKIDMHSFHEVMAAAEGFPYCQYKPGNYIPFRPIPAEDMRKLGAEYLKTVPEMAKAVTGENDIKKQVEYLLHTES